MTSKISNTKMIENIKITKEVDKGIAKNQNPKCNSSINQKTPIPIIVINLLIK